MFAGVLNLNSHDFPGAIYVEHDVLGHFARVDTQYVSQLDIERICFRKVV